MNETLAKDTSNVTIFLTYWRLHSHYWFLQLYLNFQNYLPHSKFSRFRSCHCSMFFVLEPATFTFIIGQTWQPSKLMNIMTTNPLLDLTLFFSYVKKNKAKQNKILQNWNKFIALPAWYANIRLFHCLCWTSVGVAEKWNDLQKWFPLFLSSSLSINLI